MKYSRNEINRAGYALIGDDPFMRQEADAKITDWRQSHLPVLRELNEEVTQLLIKENIPFEFSSHRIKRMQSIVEKLRNNKDKSMGLGGLQDIGGIRFVFPDIETLKKADEVLRNYKPKNFSYKSRYDYVTDSPGPKPSGYRSIHHVYKYESENRDYDGLQIELQIRTKLQHYWAMAVETASLISGNSLKAAVDDGSLWRDFFRLVSAVFSKKEGTPVLEEYRGSTDIQICKAYAIFHEEHKLVDQFLALRVTVNQDHKEIEEGYCVLNNDFEKKVVYFQYYNTAEEAKASDVFTRLEKQVTSNEAALMVSMEKLSEIRKAYPSYFLDTGEFLQSLREFDDHCATLFANNPESFI